MRKELDNYPVNKVIPWCCSEYAKNVAFDAELGKRQILYSELLIILKKLSLCLYDLGCRGKNVALIGKNSCEYAIVLLSALCSDMTLIPIDPTLKGEEMRERIRLCDAGLVLADSEAAGKLGSGQNQGIELFDIGKTAALSWQKNRRIRALSFLI